MDLPQALKALAIAQQALNRFANLTSADTRATCKQLALDALHQMDAVCADVEAPTPELRLDPELRYHAYADGASRGNPGNAAWGVVVFTNEETVVTGKGYLGIATNQVAELNAAIEALKRVPEGGAVTLYSDSQYTLKGISEWRKGWERNSWRTSKGGEVANKELWQQLFALVDKRRVQTQWVRGHAGNQWNEKCDQLANQALDAVVR